MKKILALVLAVLMCAACFVSCGEKEDDKLVCGVTIFEKMNEKDADGKDYYKMYYSKIDLDISKGKGWEEFESTPLDGLEVVRTRRIDEYSRQILLIPNNHREFTNYIQRCNKELGMSIAAAYDDLKCIIEAYGSQHAKNNFGSYKPRWNVGKKVTK